ncbi:MAG: hypothetical protein AAF600_22590 [Bacteroidota bacterium]
MPDIGRFFNVDPLAEDYVYNSTYAFSENDVISAIELEGLEKIRVNNYSLHQSNSIKQQTLKKREINQRPYSDRTGPKNDFKIEKLEDIQGANTEIRRIVDYGMNIGFKDDFMVNQLEENGIKVPDEVKNGDKATASKVMNADAPLSIDIIGIQETEDGSLQEVSIGSYNPENETENVKADFWKDVAGSVIESIVDYFIMKGNSPQLIAPVTVPDEEQEPN